MADKRIRSRLVTHETFTPDMRKTRGLLYKYWKNPTPITLELANMSLVYVWIEERGWFGKKQLRPVGVVLGVEGGIEIADYLKRGFDYEAFATGTNKRGHYTLDVYFQGVPVGE